jgi:hypothetical protein
MDALHADIIYWMGESAKYCRRQRTEQKIKERHTWIAPSDDWLKINCDGSYTHISLILDMEDGVS